jgi:hypothetical protein
MRGRTGDNSMMKLLVVESVTDELIPERYKETWGISNKKIWDTIEVSDADFQRYEELRIALDELKEELKNKEITK